MCAVAQPRMLVARRFVRWLSLILLACVAWRSINYFSGTEPGPDSSVFMSMATHAIHGRVIYKDVWEQKPPMIFVLDAIALGAGDGTVNSVRAMERFFAVAGVAAFSTTVFLAFESFWLAYLVCFVYLLHFYAFGVVEYGNVTEEYGAIFAIAGIAAAVASVRFSGRRSLLFAALSGLALSASVLSKEPFLLLVAPWVLFVAWPRASDWKGARQRGGACLCGAGVPVLVFVGYLLAHGAWSDWIGILEYEYAYSSRGGPVTSGSLLPGMFRMAGFRVFHLSLVTEVAALMGLASLMHRSFIRRTRGLPVVIAASAALSLLATTLSGRFYGHYYLMFVPSYVLLAATGIAFAIHLVVSARRQVAVAVAVVLAFVIVDRAELRGFARLIAEPAQRWQGSWLSDIVRTYTLPDDMIWAPWNTLLYTETGRLSPTKWHCVFDVLFIDTPQSTRAEKFAMLRNDLERRPPRLIVVSAPPGAELVHAQEFLANSGLTSWIAENYRTAYVSPGGANQVLVLKR